MDCNRFDAAFDAVGERVLCVLMSPEGAAEEGEEDALEVDAKR